ncbi:unnamed protein product [Arctia plantaginis]|uniref:Metaxin-2 n=1 Tax=Arctia plantaginis TaxID=874455 RepID=A0A8S1A969_ARCPL|nr:unnamed protein product [Arctia plantaginis]CAB3262001.1 unnamed protein product [Arctia plantaginis]
MPEYHLTDSIITQLNAQEPWPDNVKLFQPYEVEQILLPDNASCLAVQAFLKMCNLPFEVEMRWNAEFMSPSGRVPFIKCGAFVVSELEPIVQFAANKGVTLCSKLSTEEKAEMRAYMSLITNVLVNAELYISWVDNDTFNAVTKVRNSSVYPWPLGWLQTRAKRNLVIKRLKALHWYDKSLEQVLADVEQCCNSLSQRLGERDYFFGNTPTALDARVFGHIRALLSAQGPKAALMIKPITTSLLRHMLRMINITEMKMTPQEEYLLYQAFRLPRVSFQIDSPSERNTKTRSRMSTKNTSRETFNSREIYGFKPFASKQMVIMTSKEGMITCKPTKSDQEGYTCVLEICEDILDKVDEYITNEFYEKTDSDTEKNDFEVIAYPKENTNSKMSDYLDTIAENDVSDTMQSGDEDMLQLIRDDDLNELEIVNEKHMDSVSHSKDRGSVESRTTISSKLLSKDSPLNLTMSGGRTSDDHESEKSDVVAPPESSDSKATLKMPLNEDISVESLLRYLRKQNVSYNYVADLD